MTLPDLRSGHTQVGSCDERRLVITKVTDWAEAQGFQ